jgi:hypothetical protein
MRWQRACDLIDADHHLIHPRLAMPARIYQPAKSAMQSGLARTKEWVLEHEPAAARGIDPLMGWTSSTDTQAQVRLEFDTREEAIAYAERNGIAYTVAEPQQRKPVRKSYADNFKFGRPDSWTH